MSGSDPELRIRLDLDGPATLVVAGEIDLLNWREFAAAVARACQDLETLALDLTAVTYMSSAGIGVLYRHLEQLSTVFIAEEGIVVRVLRYAGLPDMVPVSKGPSPAAVRGRTV